MLLCLNKLGYLEPISNREYTMKNKFIFMFVILCSTQIMANNFVLVETNNKQRLHDIATIGKWIYTDNNLQLLDIEGNILATEPLSEIKKITITTSGLVTTTNNATTKSIVIYPNPTQEILIISGIESQILRIYDLQGRLLKEGNGTQINVSNLANGTYLLQVDTQVVRFMKK